MVYVACPLAFGLPSLPLPSSNARHPASAPARPVAPATAPARCARPVAPATAPARCARPRPPFGASKLHSLKRLQSHELNEYCTTPFCNGAFQGEIRYTGAPSRVTYGTLAYLIRSPYHFIQGKICVIRTLSPTALTISYDLANLLISLLLDAFESFSEDSI